MKEFDSEFCNVKYIEKDKAVLLTWEKFACGDDYRKPTTFAWELLKENVGSKFIGGTATIRLHSFNLFHCAF